MSYSLLYYNDLINKAGNTVTIQILKSGYTGQDYNIKMGATINYPDKELYEPFFSQGVELTLLNTKQDGFLKYASLIGTPEREHKVIIYEGTTTLFEGYIVPDFYEDEYNNLPQKVRFASNDGLSDLKRFKPDISSVQSVIQIITNCLQYTGHNYDVYICSTLFETGHTTISKTLFEQTYLDYQALYKNDGEQMNCEEILKEKLKSFGCFIYQKNRRWYIQRFNDLYINSSTDREYIKYSSLGVNMGTVTETPTVLSLNSDITWRDSNQKLTYKRGLKKITVEQELSKYSNLIVQDKIDNSVEQTKLVTLNPTRHSWEHHETIDMTITEGSSYFNITPVNYVANNGFATKTIFSCNDDEDVLKISYETEPDYYSIQQHTSGTLMTGIVVMITNSSGTFWLEYDEDDNKYIRSTTEKVIEKDCSYAEHSGVVHDFNLKEISIDIPIKDIYYELDSDNTIVVKWLPTVEGTEWEYNNTTAKTYYRNLKVEMDVANEQDNVIEGVINTDYIDIKEIKLKFSDVENTVYKSGYMLNDYTRTKSWYDQHNSTGMSLTNKYIVDGFQMYNQPRYYLSGDIISHTLIQPDTIITDDNLPNKDFFIRGLRYDILNNTYRVKLIEYVANDSVSLA